MESAENAPEAAETRPDPIFPVVIERIEEPPEREAGRLAFAGIVEDRKSLPAQLPLLPRPEGPRVPILELSDWRGVPTMERGRGAPLDLRLAVGAYVLTPHVARAARGRLVATVREPRDFLFPNGWERRRDWPRVREALFRARDYVIPDGTGTWLPFALRREPGENAGLDDFVRIDVELPSGSTHGPIIDRRDLAQLGVRSAPKFRAYIAAHSVAWLPGVTRRPHPRNPRFHLWSSATADYPILTRKDRRRLAFGAKDKRDRNSGQPRRPMGGSAGRRDPDPQGVHGRRPPWLARGARRGGRCAPEAGIEGRLTPLGGAVFPQSGRSRALTGQSRSRKPLQYNTKFSPPPRLPLKGRGGGAGWRRLGATTGSPFPCERRFRRDGVTHRRGEATSCPPERTTQHPPSLLPLPGGSSSCVYRRFLRPRSPLWRSPQPPGRVQASGSSVSGRC